MIALRQREDNEKTLTRRFSVNPHFRPIFRAIGGACVDVAPEKWG